MAYKITISFFDKTLHFTYHFGAKTASSLFYCDTFNALAIAFLYIHGYGSDEDVTIINNT